MSTELSALQERMAALKAKDRTENPNESKRSTDSTPTPLWAFLYIYERAQHECYIDYMKGAKELYKWLGPLEFPADKFPDIDNPAMPIPSTFQSYEIARLADIMTGYNKPTEQQLADCARAQRAIMVSTYKEVLPLLY